MPGGFHPFHPGHKSLYDWAVKQFGQTNVYVAATNNQETRPFPFDVKKQLASFAGVPPTNFIQVKSPFNMNSYTGLLDSSTALVFIRSKKDETEQPLPDKIKKDAQLDVTLKNLGTGTLPEYFTFYDVPMIWRVDTSHTPRRGRGGRSYSLVNILLNFIF